MQWDIFCRVIDNFGDIGVCWRLAADLASRGEAVRLWVDDPAPLAWMAPHGTRGVIVHTWEPASTEPWATEPGDVVVEAFACDPPAPFVKRMAERSVAPVWVNLEYLSAEPGVERNHGLPSPQFSGPGRGLVKWFFYPGFTGATGGLIRERDLLAQQHRFNATEWLHAQGLARAASEQVVSLFCYANPAVPRLLDELARSPTLLLVTAGQAAQQVLQELGPALRRGVLRAAVLPLLTQREFDGLLWACDLNFVRGEDSFVRAQWAGKRFVWHIYPQQDGVHEAKLEAFLDRFLAGADAELAGGITGLWRAWNGISDGTISLPPQAAWRTLCADWRTRLLDQADLAQQLIRFVAERR
jgi:uncharacterized repeat protein (TIGR03837 family)